MRSFKFQLFLVCILFIGSSCKWEPIDTPDILPERHILPADFLNDSIASGYSSEEINLEFCQNVNTDEIMEEYSPYSPKDLYDEFYSTISQKQKKLLSQGDLWIYMAYCDGGITILCDHPLFGEAPGTNLAKHFIVSYPKAPIDKEFNLMDTEGELTAEQFFRKGDFIPQYVRLRPSTPFENSKTKVTLSIKIPIKKEMNIAHLRELKYNPYAQLSLEPSLLSSSIAIFL